MAAGLYSEVYPLIEDSLLKLGDYGKLTFPAVVGVDPWFIIVPFVIIVNGILFLMDRIDKKRAKATQIR